MAEMPIVPPQPQADPAKGTGKVSGKGTEAIDSKGESTDFSRELNKRIDGYDKADRRAEREGRPERAAAAEAKGDAVKGKDLPQEGTAQRVGQVEEMREVLALDPELGRAMQEQTDLPPMVVAQAMMESRPQLEKGAAASLNTEQRSADRSGQLAAKLLAAQMQGGGEKSASPVSQAVQNALDNGRLPLEGMQDILGKAADLSQGGKAVQQAMAQLAQLNQAGQGNASQAALSADRPAGMEGLLNNSSQAGFTPATVTGNPATSQSGLPTTNVPLPLNHPQWGEAVSERVTWVANQKLQGAEIKLNPPQLGPIEVRVQLSQDNGQTQAQVNFSAHHSLTREALEAALPRLREMFSTNGMDLVDVNVSDRSFAEQDADPRTAQGGAHANDPDGAVMRDEETGEVVAKVTSLPTSAIDFFA